MSDARKRLFVVTYTCQAVVFAETDGEACEVAKENEDDIIGCGDGDWDAIPLRYVPDGWENPKTLVYHSGQEDIDLFPLLMECPDLSEEAKATLRKKAVAWEVEAAAREKEREARVKARKEAGGV